MFSIIIPSYNRNKEIAQLLDSLIQQTLYNFEVIIVDDCSNENLSISKEYPFKVSIIRNHKNAGAAGSRNIGANAATQEWLLFLDDDDRFITHKCEILSKNISENTECNFIYHPAYCEMVNERFSYETKPYKLKSELTIENILLANKIGGMPMIGIKKSFFMKIGGLSSQLRSLEDYDFLLKVISDSEFSPMYIDQALTHCYFHTKRSSVSTDTLNTEKAIQYIQETYVKTPKQKENFHINSNYILAYPNIMNLSRKAAKYYFKIFKLTKNIKTLIITLVILLSPKLAINLKRFI